MSDYNITEIQDKTTWESFPLTQEQGNFLQSWNFGEMSKSLGQTPHYLRITSGDGQTLGQCLTLTVRARRGTHLYLPYGPVLTTWSRDILDPLIAHLKTLALSEHASFIKMSPMILDTPENRALVHSLGFKDAPIHVLTETAWHLDLGATTGEDNDPRLLAKNENNQPHLFPEGEVAQPRHIGQPQPSHSHKYSEGEVPQPRRERLLSNMDKKHRNLIRRAEKEGVTITKSTSPEDLEKFWVLYSETSRRHDFTRYPKSYIENQLSLFGQDQQCLMLSAIYQGQTIASALIMYYGKIAAYHHGASSSNPEHRKIPASYLLQWEAIKEAVNRHCHTYSFWGVAPFTTDQLGNKVYQNPKHPFCGITHFKTGFGGHRVDFLPAQDLPLNKKYLLNFAVEKMRKWRRGF